MTTALAYAASPLKRQRATRFEMQDRHDALWNIVCEMQPMTVRQVYYQATVRGIVDKTEDGYDKVQRALVDMRRAGRLPYDWIADNTRWQRKPHTYRNPAQALHEIAAFYRKDLWADADSYVEIWLEKDALAGVVMPVTSLFDVPLMVARGYASLSFLHGAASFISELEVPSFIYHFGDFDPSGVNAAEKIEQTLMELAPNADITFERVAITEADIRIFNLPSRPTKTTDSRSKNFGSISVELDALKPDLLRAMVREVIERHLPPAQFAILKTAEASEREQVQSWAERLQVRS